MSTYGGGLEEVWFRSAWAKSGKRLDMGKCCVRFRKLDDLALDVVGEAIRRVPARQYLASYVRFLSEYRAKSPGKKSSRRKAVAKPKAKLAAQSPSGPKPRPRKKSSAK